MRGKEQLIPHADRAGRWLGWLTVWSDLSTSVFLDVLLCPGCEFGVCEFGLCLLPAAEAAVRENGELQNTNPR